MQGELSAFRRLRGFFIKNIEIYFAVMLYLIHKMPKEAKV